MAPDQVESASRWLSASNTVYILACAMAVAATFCVVRFGNQVTRLKEAELATYRAQATAEIEAAKKDAASAHATAELAIAEQEKWKAETLRLQVQLAELETEHAKLVGHAAQIKQHVQALENAARPKMTGSGQPIRR